MQVHNIRKLERVNTSPFAKQRSNIQQTVLGDFYSARAVSRHPRIPSWIRHCSVKLKQLRESIF